MSEIRASQSKDDKMIDFTVNMIGIGILVVILYPLIYVISASLSDPAMVATGQVYLLPRAFSLEGYKIIFEYQPIWIGYRNTLLYTTAGTFINVSITLTCAYALSRKDMVGSNFITLLFTFTMFFSGGLIPTYLVVYKLGLVNTFWALLLPNAASIWNIIIARSFFQSSIPFELKEAAFIDGCTNTRLFWNIVLPLSKPIIAVLILFYAISHWNSFFYALIYLSDAQLFPLQLVLRNVLIMDQMMDLMGMDADAMSDLMRRMMLKESMKFGIIVVSSLPVLILYPFMQKYFVKGVMIGSIKG